MADQLRKTVVERALLLSAVGLPTISASILAWSIANAVLTRVTIAMCVGTLGYPLLWTLRKRLTVKWSGGLLLGLLAVMSFALELRGGVSASSAAVQLLVIVLAGLIFDRKGAGAAFLLTLVAHGIAGFLVVSGSVPAIPPALWDPYRGFTWFRAAMVLLVLGGASVAAVIHMVGELERETNVLRDALAREKVERAARARAEAERERVQMALSESHRVEALGHLAGGVAHDFNNTLTIILSAAELALADEHPVNPEVRESLLDIEQAAKRASELTSELLSLGRKDAALPVAVDLDTFLVQVAPTLRRVLPSDILLQVDPVGGSVKANPVQLERMLLNLIVNARDAMQGGGRLIVGGSTGATENGPFVELFVSDNGAGMTEEVKLRLFEPFFTTKTCGRGSGLGMYVVKRFAEDSGGGVEVSSCLGKGTTISIRLPRVANPVSRPPSVSADSMPTDIGRGRTVLVADDEPLVRAGIARLLERNGFTVVLAADGDAALRFVQDARTPIDVICIDGVMPGVSSGTVIAEARTLRFGVGILVCSGYVEEELVLRGVRAGELAFVSKPFTSAQLLAGIAAQLPQARRSS